MKKKYLLFFGQNYYFKIDTTEISIFNFGRTLIIVSINYDIYKEKIYDIWACLWSYIWPL